MMRRPAFAFVICLLLVAFVYRRAPVEFLRAESGWYLAMSHSSAAVQRQFTANFFTTSYGGHYTPFAFLAEFETAKIAGSSRAFWRWRQLIVLSALGAAIFVASAKIGEALGLTKWRRGAVAAVVAATAMFQPQMLDIVVWPFMVLQLVWCALYALAIFAIVQLAISSAKPKWCWIAAAIGYASLHVSGLGIVTVAAVAASLAAMTLYGRCRAAGRALITLLAVSAAHAAAMIFLLPKANAGSPVMIYPKLILGFIANFAVAGLRTFTGSVTTEVSPYSLAYCWPYALVLIFAVALAVWVSLRRASRDRTDLTVLVALLCASTAAASLAMIALIIARVVTENSPHAAATTLALLTHTSRYVVPLHALLIPPVAALLVLAMRKAPSLTVSGCCMAAVAAVIAQREFQKTAYPYLQPSARVSHYSSWKLILATARECRAAGLPLPNVPLGALTQEFSDVDPRMFVGLIRRDLHLREDEQIALVEWRDYLAGDRTKYTAVPSLRKLEQRLGVEEN